MAVLIVFGLLLSGVYGIDKTTMTTDDDGGSSEAPVDTCTDGIDNDGDGMTDEQDFECDPSRPEYDGSEDTNNAAPPPP